MSVVANVAINIDGKQAQSLLKAIQSEVEKLNGSFDQIPKKTGGIFDKLKGGAMAVVRQLAAVTGAAAAVQKSLSVAFERGAAEQRLKNLTSSTGEYEAALAAANLAADKFGMSQTDATQAFAEAYGRLNSLGFGLKEVNEVYVGFNNAARAAGVSVEDANGAFVQLAQGMSAGVLNGENLVTILERMPQLGKLLADSMGVSAGEIKKLGSEGKITTDVIYKALKQSADAAGDLNGKLTDQQKAFNSLGRVTDNLLNTMGQVFAPFVIKGAELLAAAGQKLSEWWDYLGKNVLPRVLQAIQPAVEAFQKLWSQIPWDTIVGYIQGAILVGIQRIVTAIEFLSPIIGFVVAKFAELAQNPVFKFIAEQVGNLLNSLGLSSQEVSNFTAKQKEAEQATAGTVSQYSSMPAKINDATDAIKKQKQEVEAAQEARDAEFKAAQELRKLDIMQFDEKQAALQEQLKSARSLAEAQSLINTITANGRKLEQERRQGQIEEQQHLLDTIANKKYDLQLAAEKAKGEDRIIDQQLMQIGFQERAAREHLNYLNQLGQESAIREDINRKKMLEDAITAEIGRKNEAITRQYEEQVNAIDNKLQLQNALAQATTTINNLEIQSLERDLQRTVAASDRETIIKRINALEIENAKVALFATRAQIKADVARSQLAYQQVALETRRLRAVIAIARAEGVINQAHIEALQQQESALRIATDSLRVNQQIADVQWRAADAVYKAAVNAANLKSQMLSARQAASGLASAVASAAGSMTQALGGSGQSSIAGTSTFVEGFFIRDPIQGSFVAGRAQSIRSSNPDISPVEAWKQAYRDIIGPFPGDPPRGTSGNDANRPANPVPIEIRPDSYIVVPPPQFGGRSTININTGPVMQQQGQTFITLEDFEKGLQQLADVMLDDFRSAGGRRYQGVN